MRSRGDSDRLARRRPGERRLKAAAAGDGGLKPASSGEDTPADRITVVRYGSHHISLDEKKSLQYDLNAKNGGGKRQRSGNLYKLRFERQLGWMPE